MLAVQNADGEYGEAYFHFQIFRMAAVPSFLPRQNKNEKSEEEDRKIGVKEKKEIRKQTFINY